MALTPLIAVQIMGMQYKWKLKKAHALVPDTVSKDIKDKIIEDEIFEDDIFDFEEED